MKRIIDGIYYVGVNDHEVDLFEGQYKVANGMSYNSYVIMDEKIAIIDTVDANFSKEWLENISSTLKGKTPDYLVVHHMEPDHSANIASLIKAYPNITVVGNVQTFKMIEQFFGNVVINKQCVKENDLLKLGKHSLKFVFAPMVHWPEVMMSYEPMTKTFFSADAFGKFGALDVEEEWLAEARRYYIGIVGKYGAQVQNLFKKLAGYEIGQIFPLHGPMLTKNLDYYFGLYDIWSSYKSEDKGVLIAYCSIYGNTKASAMLLYEKLIDKKCKVLIFDLARSDMSNVVAQAFRFSKVVLASPTYNSSVFPFMEDFIHRLKERNFQGKAIGLIENGTWSAVSAKVIKNSLQDAKGLEFLEPVVSIKSRINNDNIVQIEELLNKLIQ